MLSLQVTTANRSKIVTKTGFKGYDICVNSYVGCQFGCAYCYVRFFIKDPQKPWGEFVRLRRHVHDKLPRELAQHAGERLVIGTMTDPWQPTERKERLTRAVLDHILNMERPLNKVGVFTRSPIVLEDLERLTRLPRGRVHYTVTPYPPEILRLIEPIAIRTDRRFATIKELKAAGLRVHCNVAPVLPTLSERFTDEFAAKLAELGVDEFFVDPMQAYGESWEAISQALAGRKEFEPMAAIVRDKERYAVWKEAFQERWTEAWRKVQPKAPHTLPIWSDHEHKTWIDMRTGQQMDTKRYGDDLGK